MSGLAQVVYWQGNSVSGSDRNFDQRREKETLAFFKSQGIKIFPQNGSGISRKVDEVVISGAIEEENLDLKRARELSLSVVTRAELLARIFNPSQGIAIAGTSGKSTITAMVAKIMDEAFFDPTVINGAIISEYKNKDRLGNAKIGKSNYMVIEADESDGSLVKFSPEIGVLANISKDHKPVNELMEIFSQFIQNTKRTRIINYDCPFSRKLLFSFPRDWFITFGFTAGSEVWAEEIKLNGMESVFRVDGVPFHLPLPGRHNVANALAAIALGIALNLPLPKISQALEKFSGVERRLTLIGEINGIKVFDDFSHNPTKIAAAIETLKHLSCRLILVYQPHGFGPTKLFKRELIATFNSSLEKTDILILLDIFYAGGRAEKTISSQDLEKDIIIPQVQYISERKEVIKRLTFLARPGDVVVVMGARDNTLTDLSQKILINLRMQDSLKTKRILAEEKK